MGQYGMLCLGTKFGGRVTFTLWPFNPCERLIPAYRVFENTPKYTPTKRLLGLKKYHSNRCCAMPEKADNRQDQDRPDL